MARNKIRRPEPDSVISESGLVYPERERKGYVMGSADGEYGYVSGFRFGITQTGHAHKAALTRRDRRLG